MEEHSSLEGTILTQLEPGTAEYEKARKDSTSGRFLLDVKRSGKMKPRGIKQGFKEDKETADGFDFNYYSHVPSSLWLAQQSFDQTGVEEDWRSKMFLQRFFNLSNILKAWSNTSP